MDSTQAANIAPNDENVAAAPARQLALMGVQSLWLPITLLLLALGIVFGLGALVRHFGGVTDYTAYAAALLAALALLLLLLGEWRLRSVATTRLLLGCSPEQWSLFAVFVFFLALYGVTRFGPTPFYEPSLQAAAFLHGHAWVDAPGYMEQVGPICNTNLPIAKTLPECDFTRFHNHTFLVHPPLAAIIMMPIVAARGRVVEGADRYQPSMSVIVGAIELALVWQLLLLLGLSTSARLWLTAFFGLGTTLWYEATLGASWDFVLVVSVLPTLLALNEAFGKARPWVVGIWAALAALGRNDLVLAWPAYGLLLVARGNRLRSLFGLLPGFAMAGAVYGVFNYARYGTFFDQSLWLWYRCCDGQGYFNPAFHRAIPGPFSPQFIATNLHTLLFMGWGFSREIFPWLHPVGAGQALLLTSPAFVLALRPSLKKLVTLSLWIASILTMSASLTVYNNGFMQFGPRYYVQIFPFLLVLVALGVGAGRRIDQLTRILILASILLVSFGVWHIHMFSFG